MSFLTTFITVGLLVALAIPGYILKKLKMLPESTVMALVTILMFVNQPFLTIKSFATKEFDKSMLISMLVVFILSFVLMLIMFFIAKLTFIKTTDENRAQNRVAILSSLMSNCGFMGIPLMQALFPENLEVVIYCAIFIVAFNILNWTLGVFVLTNNKSYISVKKAFLNPPTIALVVALPLFFLKVKLPASIMQTVSFLGDMTTPMSMIIMGIRLAEMRIVDLFKGGKVYVVSALRLIVAPLITLGICMLINLVFPLDKFVIIAMYLIMALPTAASTVLFAERFSGDSYFAVKTALATSLYSIITIPALMLLTTFL